ncbi:hypothetical protein PHPALM_28033 [Phytophthora palmivora]|uniref:Uncharacterized protein n=1 Tax=Phytophthora palmivora TaxID=4796 RepID=A0A2P4XB27_9STRA|nr:hypothetical protein PHPALM_28033 [Phytophthora palmivora]
MQKILRRKPICVKLKHQASLLLSNSVLVFPDVTCEYANWLNDHDRKMLKLAAVLQRLRPAEHHRQ